MDKCIAFYGLLIFTSMMVFSIFGCFKKKDQPPKNIEDWLDLQWTGRFEVISTPTNFTDKDYYFDKRESVIAEKADKEVQFILSWNKGEKDFGLTREMVEERHSYSRANVKHARALSQALKAAGMEKVSVGIARGTIYIFVFAKPAPEIRARSVQSISNARNAVRADSMSYEICFMEEEKYDTEFKEIIPAGHWVRRDSWQHDNEIMRLSIPVNADFNLEMLASQWQFNTMSEKMLECIANAHTQTLKWAEKNMPEGITIEGEHLVEFSVDESDGLLINIDFPYFETAEESASGAAGGMISGVYHFDKESFSQIHVKKQEADGEE